MAIDHKLHPHILDAILEHAAVQLLLAFRATCRSLSDRADSLLFGHLVLTGTTELELSSPRGRLPLRWIETFESTDSADALNRSIKLLAHAHILDCHTKLDIADVAPTLASALAHVEIVRRFEPTATALPAPQVIDFAYLTPGEGHHAHADSSISSACDCASTFTFDVPKGTATSITHVLYDPRRVPIHSFLQLGHCPDSTHSVIVYNRRSSEASGASSPTPMPAPDACGSDEPQRLGMLGHLVEELGLRIGHAITVSGSKSGKHTLVGIDEIDNALLSLPHDTPDTDVQAAIVDAVQEECSIYFPQEVARHVPSALAFASRADLAAELGHEALMVVTPSPPL
jgi:hypothetical protein